jgi:phytoene dehydrogenase-like protein
MLKDAEKVFPTLRDHIEEIDISTPLTHMRYLGHIHGSIYGFDQFMKDQPPFVTPKGPIPGLFETGASVAGGGFQPTLENGAKVARVILREMGV